MVLVMLRTIKEMKKQIILLLLLTIKSYGFKEKKTILKSTSIIKKEIMIKDKILSNSELINTVLSQLNLKKENCKTSFISVKDMPNSKEMSIVIIPEISSENEEEYSFELNSYILIVNKKTGKIKSKFYESSKTNDWTSDALMLTNITIDTAPYTIRKNKRAFGVRVHYLGSSKPNPYEKETISLFIEDDNNKLNRVLNKYEINGNFGEWDMNCAGEFTYFNSILIISKTTINDYYNINVKTTTIKTNNFEAEIGDCKSTDIKTINKTKLIFNGNEYKING